MAHTDAGTTQYPTEARRAFNERPESPIRIAHVVGKVVMGGVDQVVMNYYRHIDRTKVQFDIYMDGLNDTPLDAEIRALGGRVFKLPPYDSSLRENLAAFREHLCTNDYPIVHSHMNTLSGFWLREAKRARVPVRIAHSHSTVSLGERKRAVMKYALRPFAKAYATDYLACSQHAGKWQFGKRTFEAGEVRLVKNAIAAEQFARCDVARRSVRKELGLDGKFVVGHVGRFEHPKNHQFLVEVFDEVQRLRPDTALLLVGHGELRQDIEELCRRKGVAEKVFFTGVRSDVPRLMQAMDCFVFPSHFEGLGMAVVEAQAAGLPCIVSTEVPNEAAITRAFMSLSLEDSSSKWAREVLRLGAYREQPSEANHAVRAAGYCIDEAAPTLASLYQQLYVPGPAAQRCAAPFYDRISLER